jgi:hypothetical protein
MRRGDVDLGVASEGRVCRSLPRGSGSVRCNWWCLALVGRQRGAIGSAVLLVVLGVSGACRALVFAVLVQGQIVCALMEWR